MFPRNEDEQNEKQKTKQFEIEGLIPKQITPTFSKLFSNILTNHSRVKEGMGKKGFWGVIIVHLHLLYLVSLGVLFCRRYSVGLNPGRSKSIR
jgi:hypothetical protein